MRESLVVVAALFSISASAFAEVDNLAFGKQEAVPSVVHSLKGGTEFLNWISETGTEESPVVSLVKFCTPYNAACRALSDDFEAAARELQLLGIDAASVNCIVDNALCEAEKVKGYPSLRAYRNGKVTKFVGEKSRSRMVKFMQRQIRGPIRELLNQNDLDSFKASEDFVVIGHFNDKSSEYFKNFSKASLILVEYAFGYVISAGISAPFVTTHKLNGEESKFSPEPDTESYTRQALLSFVNSNALPLLQDLTLSNFKGYMDSKLPVGFTFYFKDAERDQMTPILNNLAKMYRTKLNFAFVDGRVLPQIAKAMSDETVGYPQFVLNEFIPEYNSYVLKPKNGLVHDNGSELSQFIENYFAGKLTATWKSEEIPVNNEGPVKIIVGKNFNDIVMDPGTDVVLLVYEADAEFNDTYFERALIKASQKVSAQTNQILFGKMDMVANDFPKGINLKASHTPSLMLIAGDLSGKEQHADVMSLQNGSLGEQDIIAFLKKHSRFSKKLNGTHSSHDEL